MNRPGPGPQPLRAMPGNIYQNQQAGTNRGAPLGSARLQNGKLGAGNTTGWGFGGPMAGAPGLSSGQSRTNFAQTIGGSQSQTPLDLSEFPSLSGTQHAQQSTTSQAIWGNNPNIRLTQHTPVQRPQNQNTQQPGQQGPQHDSQSQDDSPSAASQSQFRTGAEDYRFGAQGGVGQLTGASQPQIGNSDDFPPLAGGGELDRRTSILQNAPFSSGTTSPFPNLAQSRNGLSSPGEGPQDRSLASAVGDRAIQPGSGRGPLEERNGGVRPPQGLVNTSFGGHQASQLPFRQGAFQDAQQQQQQPGPIGSRPAQIQRQLEQNYGVDMIDSPNTGPPRQKRLAEMTEKERFGLPGLLAMVPPDSPDHSSLAVGQDLTVLGLDLNRPDNSPLYPTFGSPFVEPNGRPVIPDFTLPGAYTVNNVPPLHTKMSSFSAETLLMIFYQNPRDIMQEMAAGELYNRDWRWHKLLKQWMMKDPELPPPIRTSEKSERGWYIFFDVTNWRRERREFELHYEHLDQRHAPNNTAASL